MPLGGGSGSWLAFLALAAAFHAAPLGVLAAGGAPFAASGSLAQPPGRISSDAAVAALAMAPAVAVCAALLLAWAGLPLPWKQRNAFSGGSRQSPERLRVFAKWAQQQIEESRPEAHRQMLDDVIFTFAAYAQRLEKDAGRASRRSAVPRLRVLIELLETPSVNRALREVNWAWLREWDQQQLESREARLRCTVVFPTILAAARVQGRWRWRRPPDAAAAGGLPYLAGWCADFLERPDVRSFLGLVRHADPVAERDPGSRPLFSSAGTLISESSDEEEEVLSPIRGGSGGCGGLFQSADGPFCRDGGDSDRLLEFSRRRFEGQEHCWDEADATEAVVRGERYLIDRRKVPSSRAMLELVNVDLIKTKEEISHYGASALGRVPRLRQDGDRRSFFIMNFRLLPIQLAIVWAVPTDADWFAKPEGILFRRFQKMSNEERNERVKVLPKVIEGPWLVKKSMPDRPGVIGRKLALEYFQRQDHLEVSINCISSPAGRHLVQLLTGAGRHFALELFVILEGQHQDELPERILGSFSVYHGDLAKIAMR